jgi:hypothetical protein
MIVNINETNAYLRELLFDIELKIETPNPLNGYYYPFSLSLLSASASLTKRSGYLVLPVASSCHV